MRVRTRWTAALMAALMALTLTACGDSGDRSADDVPTVPPATPATSPHDGPAPAGTVVPQTGAVAMAVAGSTVGTLGADGSTVTLHRAPATPEAPPPRTVRLEVHGLVDLVSDGDGFLAVGPEGLVRIGTDGAVTLMRERIESPLSLAVHNGRPLVGTAGGTVEVFSPEGRLLRRIGGFVRVDEILIAPGTAARVDGQVTVLDRAQSAVLPVDIETGEHQAALRAGNGATNAVVDHFGRISVTGTRDDEIYAFYGDPIVMRMRHPAGASPYALAYDDERNLLWVSSTAHNVATAYDLAEGDAVQRERIPTVGQVSAMIVDPASGDLYLVSKRGDGLQVVSPPPPQP